MPTFSTEFCIGLSTCVVGAAFAIVWPLIRSTTIKSYGHKDMKEFHPLNPQTYRRFCYHAEFSKAKWQPGTFIYYAEENKWNSYGEDWPGRAVPEADKAIRAMLRYPSPI